MYSIVNRESRKALTVDWVGILEDGAGIMQWYDLGYPNQHWRFFLAGEGLYQIHSVNSERCLDVCAWPDEPWDHLCQWECHDGKSQLWQLRFVEREEG
jgi:hypothetical protein